MHTVPGINLIQLRDATNLSTCYASDFKELLSQDDAGDDFEVKVPELTDPGKWIKFQDSLCERLRKIIGARGSPIDYVIDFTARATTSANAAYVEHNGFLDITDVTQYFTTVTHFGPAFMKDPKQVWEI